MNWKEVKVEFSISVEAEAYCEKWDGEWDMKEVIVKINGESVTLYELPQALRYSIERDIWEHVGDVL